MCCSDDALGGGRVVVIVSVDSRLLSRITGSTGADDVAMTSLLMTATWRRTSEIDTVTGSEY